MAIARYFLPVPLSASSHRAPEILMRISYRTASSSRSALPQSLSSALWSSFSVPTGRSKLTQLPRAVSGARAELDQSGDAPAIDAFTNVKHVLLPITDQNAYLSEGTRQAAATATTLAKKYGADITVVVIDEKPRDLIPEHDARLSAIRWHLSEGGFQEFVLMERLGEGKKPTAIIGEVADELNLDLVVLSMESIHSHYVDGNLLAEFIPCPVLLLPL